MEIFKMLQSMYIILGLGGFLEISDCQPTVFIPTPGTPGSDKYPEVIHRTTVKMSVSSLSTNIFPTRHSSFNGDQPSRGSVSYQTISEEPYTQKPTHSAGTRFGISSTYSNPFGSGLATSRQPTSRRGSDSSWTSPNRFGSSSSPSWHSTSGRGAVPSSAYTSRTGGSTYPWRTISSTYPRGTRYTSRSYSVSSPRPYLGSSSPKYFTRGVSPEQRGSTVNPVRGIGASTTLPPFCRVNKKGKVVCNKKRRHRSRKQKKRKNDESSSSEE